MYVWLIECMYVCMYVCVQDELTIVMEQLAVAKATLQEVNDRLASLEKAFNEAVEKKDMLEKK